MRRSENALPVGELFQRHLLDGAAFPSVAKTGVVHDPPVSHVDAVMRVENPLGYYMGARCKRSVRLHTERTWLESDGSTSRMCRPGERRVGKCERVKIRRHG